MDKVQKKKKQVIQNIIYHRQNLLKLKNIVLRTWRRGLFSVK
jgi:hypothetical protein